MGLRWVRHGTSPALSMFDGGVFMRVRRAPGAFKTCFHSFQNIEVLTMNMATSPQSVPLSRAYQKHWGAEIMGPGRARFALWAPDQSGLQLHISDRDHPMIRAEDGWFTLELDGVGPGDSYGFRLDGGMVVPDPAARAQRTDVHGLSLLTDPRAYAWQVADWPGRPWEVTVI